MLTEITIPKNTASVASALHIINCKIGKSTQNKTFSVSQGLTAVAGYLVSVRLPLFNSKVPAGFPSPADDHVEKRLDISEYMIDQADATFFVTIQGESMIEAGLLPNDKAVIDRSKIPLTGDIVLAVVDGEFTIKTLSKQPNGDPRLMPANSSEAYQPIDILGDMQFEIWGVVTGSFRRFR